MVLRLDGTYGRSEIHDRWEAVYRGNPLLDRLNDLVMDRIIDCVQPPPGARFLDAGCGVGDHTVRIGRKGYDCVGVDISPAILQRAEETSRALGLGTRVRFVCQVLEDLTLDGARFDVVHCRGVLMHIPDWKAALKSLCDVLKPGGHIVILENNVNAWYSRAYLAMRSLRRHRVASRLVRTEGGTELWTDEGGSPFVARIANIDTLIGALRQFQIEPLRRFATSLVGVEQLPAGWLRDAAIRVNEMAFRLRLPPSICKGNAIVGQKRK